MSHPAIIVRHLSKQYRLGETASYKTFRESIVNLTAASIRKFTGSSLSPSLKSAEQNTILALNDVSFEINPGEVVGIIGRNGAGKSTLLKVLSRITEPSSGRIELRGRVGSLLEVGTGFHPELTGHENIYLYGAILGMDRWEVTRKFDEIVAFAELEKFTETPVKRYSSGMYMRLAFAVAAHLDTEILLVDEVLAVGDVAFQEKCLGKMEDVSKKGRTILFVTHNMSSVSTLCESAILLDYGKVVSKGKASKIVDKYLSSLKNTSSTVELKDYKLRRGTGEARITRASIYNSEGKPCTNFKYGEDIYFEYEIEAMAACPKLITVVWIKTATGIPVMHLANHDDPNSAAFKVSYRKKIRCRLKKSILIPGNYLVSLWIAPDHYSDVDLVHDAIQFRMEQGDLMRRGFDMSWRNGILHSESFWTVEDINEADNPENEKA